MKLLHDRRYIITTNLPVKGALSFAAGSDLQRVTVMTVGCDHVWRLTIPMKHQKHSAYEIWPVKYEETVTRKLITPSYTGLLDVEQADYLVVMSESLFWHIRNWDYQIYRRYEFTTPSADAPEQYFTITPKEGSAYSYKVGEHELIFDY